MTISLKHPVGNWDSELSLKIRNIPYGLIKIKDT